MILAVDVGNTTIELGGVDAAGIRFRARLSTHQSRTADEYAVALRNVMQLYGVAPSDLEGAIVSSVVPPLSSVICAMVERFTGRPPLLVGPGIKTGLNIRLEDPGQLGSDKVVISVAAIHKYPLPQIIVDMSTATSISVISSEGYYLGGQVLPGIQVSHDALTAKTAQLPRVSLEAPEHIIGRNTVDCMKSGLIYGTAAMVDSLCQRIEEELGERATVILTGDQSAAIYPHCRRDGIIRDTELLLRGLWLIFQKNRKR